MERKGEKIKDKSRATEKGKADQVLSPIPSPSAHCFNDGDSELDTLASAQLFAQISQNRNWLYFLFCYYFYYVVMFTTCLSDGNGEFSGLARGRLARHIHVVPEPSLRGVNHVLGLGCCTAWSVHV